jgi:PAS domain S-box-containing protein
MSSKDPEPPVGDILLIAPSSPDDPLLAQVLSRFPGDHRRLRELPGELPSPPPDLIVVDLSAGPIEAYDFDIKLQGLCTDDAPPIVFLGDHDRTDLRERAYAAGAADYIARPLLPEELHSRLSSRLEIVAGRRRCRCRRAASSGIKCCGEHSLTERNALLQCMVESSAIGIVFWRPDGTLIEANKAFLKIFGVPDERLRQGKINLYEFCLPENRASTANAIARLFKGEHLPPSEICCQRFDGRQVPTLLGCATLGSLESLGVSFVFDLSRQKDSERKLRESRERLRHLIAHSEAAMEMERKRIAREIHDELGALLTTQQIELEMLRRELSPVPPEQQAHLKSIGRLLDKAVRVTRHVASELRPAVLNMGFLAALEWLARNFEKYSGIPCHLEATEEPVLDEARATALFRIAQESLRNIATHARAEHTWIRLGISGNRVKLRITDNGIGFDPEGIGKGSFGLIGIRERLEALGGRLEIDSAPDRGTVLLIELPLEEALCSAS